MVKVGLVKLDVFDIKDQMFSYDILQYRWQNIDTQQIKYKTSTTIPAFDEHTKNIQSDNYKHLYKLTIGELFVGTMHIDKKDMVGIFFLPSLLKKAFRYYRNKGITVDIDYISLQAFIALYKLHPEITLYYASVSPKNTLSINALIRHGFELNELIFAMKTKDGKINQGPWKHE